MKKLILLLGLLLLTSSASNAASCTYKCVEPYNMSSKLSSFLSSVTGLNFTKSVIAEAVIKKSIEKTVKADKLDVSIDSYSSKDLSNGIFKSLKITGKNINADGIYLSSMELKTLCDFNYVEYDKKGNLTFKEDLPMSFDIGMSADDINNTMQSARYQKIINDVNKLFFGGIKVSSTLASIRSNKFYYTIMLEIPFMKEQKVELTTDFKVKDGKVDFQNTRLSSNSYKFDLKRLDSIMKYLNPLDFSVSIFGNKKAKIYVKNLAIKNNIIVTDGVIVIPKD